MLTLFSPIAYFFQDDPNQPIKSFPSFISGFLKMVWTTPSKDLE